MERTAARLSVLRPTVNESGEAECEEEGETSTTKRSPGSRKKMVQGRMQPVLALPRSKQAGMIARMPCFVIARVDLIRHIGQILFFRELPLVPLCDVYMRA